MLSSRSNRVAEACAHRSGAVQRFRSLVVEVCLVVAAGGCAALPTPSSLSAPLLSCGGAPSFDAPAPSETGSADSGTSAEEVRLRSFLASPDALRARMPARGWQLLARDGDEVLFGVVQPSGHDSVLAIVLLKKAGDVWTPLSWGDCDPMLVLEGLGPATWELAHPVASTSTVIEALVGEGACSNGETAAGRIAPPLVVYGPDTISIAFGVAPLKVPAGALLTCGRPPTTPVTVNLAQPIGQRSLLDAGAAPPRVIQAGS